MAHRVCLSNEISRMGFIVRLDVYVCEIIRILIENLATIAFNGHQKSHTLEKKVSPRAIFCFVSSKFNYSVKLSIVSRWTPIFFLFCFLGDSKLNWHWSVLTVAATWKNKTRLVFNVRILRLLSRQNDFGTPKMASDIWSDKLTLRSIWFDLSIGVWVYISVWHSSSYSCIVFHTIFNVASPLPIKAFVLNFFFSFIRRIESHWTKLTTNIMKLIRSKTKTK